MKREKRSGVISVCFVLLLLAIGGWFSYVFVQQQSHLNNVDKDYVTAKARFEAAQQRNRELKGERDGLNEPHYLSLIHI